MTQPAMSEDQMVQVVRNALLVAGQEMGSGDQWPVVKDTVYKIMKDYEDLKVERNVEIELKTHLYAQIKEMKLGLDECTAEARAEIEPRVKLWEEICDAYFSDLDRKFVMTDEAETPIHIQRMDAILSTLEDHHE